MEVVVCVMNFVYHRAAGHEQHSLGHRVVEQMEHGCPEHECGCVVVTVVVEPQSCSETREDVGQLTHCGVCEYFLDVILDECN